MDDDEDAAMVVDVLKKRKKKSCLHNSTSYITQHAVPAFSINGQASA